MGDPSGREVPIGLLHSLTGTMAASETPLRDAELLAAEEINRSGGVLGRPLLPLCADGRSRPEDFAEAAEGLLRRGAAALFGCWTSASRKAVREVLERCGGLLGYPVQYEGFEESPCLLYGGSCLNQQILPALDWLGEIRLRSWFLVGSDYVFPRAAGRMIRSRAEARGAAISGERYVPLGERDFREIAREIRRAAPDAVLCTLNGDGVPAFCRALREARVDPRETTVLVVSAGEPELREAGGAALGIHACWGYFQGVDSPANRRFLGAYRRRFGGDRMASDPIVTAYSLVHLWRRAAERAGSLDPVRVRAAAIGLSLSGPLGRPRVFPNGHVARRALIGRFEADGNFRVLWGNGRPIPPLPWLGLERAGPENGDLLREALGSFTDSLDRSARLETEVALRRRAEAALERTKGELEERVRERTAELAEANRTLREARDFAEGIIRSAHAMIVALDREGRILLFNESAERITGYAREEVLGRSWFDLLVPRDRYPEIWRAFLRFGPGGFPSEKENPLLTRSGEERHVLWRNTPYRQEGRLLGTLSLGMDITDRKRAEERIRESEERFRGIFEQAAVGVCVLDLKGIFLRVNPAFCEMSGYAESDLLGRSFSLLALPEDEERERAMARSLREGPNRSFTLERRYLRKDGSVAWGRIGTSILRDLGGEPCGYVGTVLDVTDRREALEALARLNEELERKVRERTLDLASANERLRFLSEMDALTGLPNRRCFQRALEMEMRRLGRRREPLGLLMCDLDFFKNYNDRYGHIQGDVCLKAVGGVLSEAFSRAGELPARYGGEEFAVLLPGADPAVARAAGERLRRLVEALGMPHEASSAAATVTIQRGGLQRPRRAGPDARAVPGAGRRGPLSGQGGRPEPGGPVGGGLGGGFRGARRAVEGEEPDRARRRGRTVRSGGPPRQFGRAGCRGYLFGTICRTTSMTVPSRHSTTPTIRSVWGTGSMGPHIRRARSISSSAETRGTLPASLAASIRSVRRGLIVTPYSVTTASTTSPGVVTVWTDSTTQGIRPRSSGWAMIVSFAPAAVSWCPPMPWRSAPSASVLTLAWKFRSTSVAPRMTTSSMLTAEPQFQGLAYQSAEISMWFGFSAMERTASRSKDCTSRSRSTSPSLSRSTK